MEMYKLNGRCGFVIATAIVSNERAWCQNLSDGGYFVKLSSEQKDERSIARDDEQSYISW